MVKGEEQGKAKVQTVLPFKSKGGGKKPCQEVDGLARQQGKGKERRQARNHLHPGGILGRGRCLLQLQGDRGTTINIANL